MKRAQSLFIMMLLFCLPALADEGMWMTGNVSKKVQGVCESVVSIDFMGTGSLISDNGLVLTNHHVAYSDVSALGTGGRNLLEDGFWARSLEEEIPIPGRSVQFLRGTIDVTDEVQELIDNGTVKQGLMMYRKLGGIMEQRYKESTGLEPILSVAWKGARYFISLYEVYSDIRPRRASARSVATRTTGNGRSRRAISRCCGFIPRPTVPTPYILRRMFR